MTKTIIFVMGVSGSGKTTIGMLLSARTGIPFFDADDYHSVANKEKMKAAHPLTDEDRHGWLLAINELAKQQAKLSGAIIACSALKEKYRQQLVADVEIPARFVWLKGSPELIRRRLDQRKGHYMPAALLQSQFEALETPADAIIAGIDAEPEIVAGNIIQALEDME